MNTKINDKTLLEKKDWLSRLKHIFRFHKKKKKIDSNNVKPERVLTDMDSYSISNNSKTRSSNSKTSSNKSYSFEYERDDNLNHNIKLPYEGFLIRR